MGPAEENPHLHLAQNMAAAKWLRFPEQAIL